MKRIKKKNTRQNKESFNKMFAEIYSSRIKDFDMVFDSSVKAISKVFSKYSIQDVVISLFASNLWLPNIASPIKHQLLLSIFATLKPEEYSNSKVITSYDDFKNFLQEIYSLLPSFEMLEDFVPEADWGNVKFYHEERIFKISLMWFVFLIFFIVQNVCYKKEGYVSFVRIVVLPGFLVLSSQGISWRLRIL